MKKQLLTLFMVLASMLVFSSAYSKIIKFDRTVTGTNGCTWRLTGWIDVSLVPPGIEHYDVWVTDCHGNKTHFVGMAINPNNGNGNGNGTGNTNYDDFNHQYHVEAAPVPDQLPEQHEVFAFVIDYGLNHANGGE
jgi:hypothetical protein